MLRTNVLGICALLVGGLTSMAGAQVLQTNTSATVINRHSRPVPVETYCIEARGVKHIKVVVREPHAAANVITKASARRAPAATDLVEVRLVNTTIYLKPYGDYLRQGHGLIDSKQVIPHAQSVWQGMVVNKAYVLRGNEVKGKPGVQMNPLPQPSMILLKPQMTPPAQPKPKKEFTPKNVNYQWVDAE
jgi:hypothetical protein